MTDSGEWLQHQWSYSDPCLEDIEEFLGEMQ
jgi:hypothetical protein